MNITSMLDKLQNLILASNHQLGLVETEVFSPQFHVEEGCSFQLIGHNKFYTISHENVRVMEDFLQLSPETISKINHVRHFGFNMIHSARNGTYRSQTFTMNSHEGFINIGLNGDGLSSLHISIKTNGGVIDISASLESAYQSERFTINNYNEIDQAIGLAVKSIIPVILTEAGFASQAEASPEVVKFMSKTAKELLHENDIDARFNYMTMSELVYAVCNDLKLNVDAVMLAVKDNQSFNSIYIPPNLTCMLSTAVEKITNIEGIKAKVDQLISLFVFIDALHDKPLRFSLTSKEIEKRDFFLKKSIDRSYYILNIGSFMIHIGHNVQKVLSSNSYMDDTKDTKLFSFFKDHRDEYVTNDFDYMYNLILTDIRDKINTEICNQSGVITLKDLEVYKMAII